MTPIAAPSFLTISPDPDDEEVAAIVAAIEAAWPRPVSASRSADPGPPRWRFSGRWWAQPTITSRRRP